MLVNALKTQDIIEHDEALAERLAAAGELVSFHAGPDIITQSGSDNSVHFSFSPARRMYT